MPMSCGRHTYPTLLAPMILRHLGSRSHIQTLIAHTQAFPVMPGMVLTQHSHPTLSSHAWHCRHSQALPFHAFQ